MTGSFINGNRTVRLAFATWKVREKVLFGAASDEEGSVGLVVILVDCIVVALSPVGIRFDVLTFATVSWRS